MRLAIVVVAVLGGCGKAREPEQRVAVEEEVPCDPHETRVCFGTRVHACEGGKLGRALRQCREGCRKGRCVGSCADGAELIYVVDDRENLLSFDPRKLPGDPFTLIGRLQCGGVGSPFSMSVDRNGVAWVLYQDGSLFEVSIDDASCRATRYRPGSSGSTTFGMGFSTDAAGGKTEQLYVAANDGTGQLSVIDTSAEPPVARRVATIGAGTAHPELTGTSEGRLYGFFPVESGTSFVQEIDKQTGATIGTRWELGDTLAFVNAYAFAQWGGVFYIFVTTTDGPSVRAIDRRTGAYKVALDRVPYRITGAGVSTCAPERDGQ